MKRVLLALVLAAAAGSVQVEPAKAAPGVAPLPVPEAATAGTNIEQAQYYYPLRRYYRRYYRYRRPYYRY